MSIGLDKNAHDKFLELEKRIKTLDKSKEILEEVCDSLGKTADVCCFLKLNKTSAKGFIKGGKADLDNYPISRFEIDLNEDSEISSSIESEIPLKINNLQSVSWLGILKRRGLVPPHEVWLFPVFVGKKVPLLFYYDRDKEISAGQVGLVNQLLAQVGSRLFSLAIEKKKSLETAKESPKEAQNEPETSIDAPQSTQKEHSDNTENRWSSMFESSGKNSRRSRKKLPSVKATKKKDTSLEDEIAADISIDDVEV